MTQNADRWRRILVRDGFQCRICGVRAGATDQYDPASKLAFAVDYLYAVQLVERLGLDPEADENQGVFCNSCNQFSRNNGLESSLERLVMAAPLSMRQRIYAQLSDMFSI